jgi:DNA-binding Xre family transcriptional regulator
MLSERGDEMSGTQTTADDAVRGEIVCRLDEVMLRAQQRWGVRVTAPRIAHATKVTDKATGKMVGLNVKTVQKLARNETAIYEFHTLAVLCWYFGCQVGDLLEYVAPGKHRSPVPVEHITRTAPPHDPPPKELTISNRLAAVIEEKGENPATIARLARLKWDTVNGHARKTSRTRIRQQTLAYLCHTLKVTVGTLFTCEKCFPPHAA